MLCAKTLKAAKAALIFILGAWATTSAYAEMNLSGGMHAPAVYAAETVSTKNFTSLVATNETFMVTAWSDVNLAEGTYHFRYDLTGDTGSAVFGSGTTLLIGDDADNQNNADNTISVPDGVPDAAVAPARARPNDLVFSLAVTGTPAIQRSTPAATPGGMPTGGTDIVLRLDGTHPLNTGTPADANDRLPSAVRPALVSVQGAASSGTYEFMLRLRIYGDLAAALSATGATLYDSGPEPIIAIDPTLSAKVEASDDLVADVLHNFTRFQDGTKGATSGELAKVTVGLKDTHCSEYTGTTCNHTPWPIMPAGTGGDGMMIEIGDVLGSGSLTVHGNHSLVDLKLGSAGLTLRDALTKPLERYTEGDNQGMIKDRSLAVDAHTTLSADGEMSLTANVGAKNMSAIPAGRYAATIALTPKNAEAAPVGGVDAGDAGGIVTNGTMVHLGYLTGFDGYNQRVIIANRGTVSADYVLGNILTEDGTMATAGTMATGTVPASSTMVIRVADTADMGGLISFDSGRARASATLSLTAPTSAISVSTTIVNISDGSTDTSNQMVQ